MKARAKILVLVYSNLALDARVLRQLRWLSRHYDVTSAAFGPSPLPDIPHIQLDNLPPYRGGSLVRLAYGALFMLGFYSVLTALNPRDNAAFAALKFTDWDVIVANDATALPLACRLPARAGILADLHEYSPQQGDQSLRTRLTENRYFRWVLRTYLRRAKRVTTVGRGIAERYSREFGVRAEVVANAAWYTEGKPTPVGRPLRLVHSAAPSPARRIDVMIDAAVRTRTDVTLDLYLVDDGSAYVRELEARAARSSRVTIHPPVANARLVEVLAGYDLGVHLLPPINFNHEWAMPNKLFDFVQARLGIVVGPSPEMARLVKDYELGVVTDGFSAADLVQVLDELDPRTVQQWKSGSDRAAAELSGERQFELFERLIEEILSEEAR